MDEKELKLCAYHEAARVVFAYMAEYHCTNLTITDTDAGNGSSILNGGNDNPIIAKIMSGSKPVEFQNLHEAYAVANRLMVLFCAGTCAQAFLESNGVIDPGIELSFPGQDSVYIEKLQNFMKAANASHSDAYVSTVIKGIFQQLAKKEVWKPITNLAQEAINSYNTPLNRYMIEDTLMGSGMKIKRPQFGAGIGLSETPDEPVKKAEIKTGKPVEIADESPLDIVLKSYLQKVRTDWNEDDLHVAVKQVKNIFSKYA